MSMVIAYPQRRVLSKGTILIPSSGEGCLTLPFSLNASIRFLETEAGEQFIVEDRDTFGVGGTVDNAMYQLAVKLGARPD